MILALTSLAAVSIYYLLEKNSIAFNPIWINNRYIALRPYVIAQSKLESENYESSLYKRANNAFGMRIPEIRKSLRIGEDNNYSVYPDVGTSLKDLILYFEAVNFPLSVESPEEYAYQLKIRGYYTASYDNYLIALKSWLQ